MDDKTKASVYAELIVGNYYNAIDEKYFDDWVYYILDGFSEYECFHNSLFAIPTDFDETELVTEEFKEKYLVPLNN
jgi:hypothetical protein